MTENANHKSKISHYLLKMELVKDKVLNLKYTFFSFSGSFSFQFPGIENLGQVFIT